MISGFSAFMMVSDVTQSVKEGSKMPVRAWNEFVSHYPDMLDDEGKPNTELLEMLLKNYEEYSIEYPDDYWGTYHEGIAYHQLGLPYKAMIRLSDSCGLAPHEAQMSILILRNQISSYQTLTGSNKSIGILNSKENEHLSSDERIKLMQEHTEESIRQTLAERMELINYDLETGRIDKEEHLRRSITYQTGWARGTLPPEVEKRDEAELQARIAKTKAVRRSSPYL